MDEMDSVTLIQDLIRGEGSRLLPEGDAQSRSLPRIKSGVGMTFEQTLLQDPTEQAAHAGAYSAREIA